MMTRVLLTFLVGFVVSLCFSERSWAPVYLRTLEDEQTQTASAPFNKTATIRATSTAWVELVTESGADVLSRLMSPGDSYSIVNKNNTYSVFSSDGALVTTTKEKIYLSTGNAAGLELVLNNQKPFSLGGVGEIIRDYSLDAAEKLTGNLTAAAGNAIRATKKPVVGPIGLSEKATVEQHVSKFWSPPAGLSNAGGLIVDIILSIDAKGNVLLAEVDESFGSGSSKLRRIMVEEAIRTIYKASPLPLPLEKAELWVGKETIFKFDPRKFMSDIGLAADMAAARGSESGNSAAKKPDQTKNTSVDGPIFRLTDSQICGYATNTVRNGKRWVLPNSAKYLHVREARRRGLSCGVRETMRTASASSGGERYSNFSDSALCSAATMGGKWDSNPVIKGYVKEAKRRGLTCGVGETTQTASAPKAKPKATSAALTAAEKEAERLRQELAALRAEKAKQQQTISSDTYIPLITANSRNKDEATSIIFGTVTDDTGVASLTVAGEVVELAADGSFQTPTYVPPSGKLVEIVAYDLKGNKASKTLSLSRKATQVALTQTFDKLQPSLGKRGKTNNAALALIVGIEAYENFPARPAIYADSDAQYFADYAHYKLGVPRGNIITAINADAKELDIRRAITKITKQSTKDKTDVFVFFAGHGLASDDEAEDVYLLPYDGDKDYLAKTSLTRSEVFKLVKRIEPRSVTVFLDACYSGATRSEDKVLVADKRPVVLEVFEQAVPDGFTVLSAAAANETSMALEEAKHGLFSYYLMRGMEGDADTNQDNKITMNEMRDYVKDKVGRQSDFKQTPQLRGDENKVLIQFQ